MKKIVVLTILVALLAVAVTPVFAGNGTPNNGDQTGTGTGVGTGNGNYYQNAGESFFSLVGPITALDPATGTVTITVAAGSYLVHEFIGTDVVVATTEETRILMACNTDEVDCTATAVTFAELVVGQNVSVKGLIDADGDEVLDWTAQRITIGAALTMTRTATQTGVQPEFVSPRYMGNRGR